MILSKTVEMNWNNKTKKHYVSKGYVFTKNKDTFQVKVEDLLSTSKKRIEYSCDYCGFIGEKDYVDLYIGREFIQKDSCTKCRYKKVEEINIIKYGCHYTQLDKVKEKQKSTMLEKYGVENYTQTKEYHIKRKETSLKKYGTEFPTQSEEVKAKVLATNIDKYGVENYTHTQEYLDKTKATNLRKYGVENVMQYPEIKQRLMNTLYQDGKAPCSQQQSLIHNLVGGELNYPVDNCYLDIAFIDDKIYLEYDGGGHDLQVKLGKMSESEFNTKERKRGFHLKSKGWREIRIVTSNDILPSNEDIINFINKAKDFLNNDLGFSIRWDLNSNIVSTNYKRNYYIKDFMNDKLIEISEAI